MDLGGQNLAQAAAAVWINPTRTITTDPATDAGASTLVWTHASRSITVDPATDAGAASLVWAHAGRSLTTPGGAILGSTLQAPATTGTISLAATGTTNAVNFSGAPGVLMQVAFLVTVATGGGNVTQQMEIVVDGGATQVIPVYAANFAFNPNLTGLAHNSSGNGQTVNSLISFILNIQFANSLVARWNNVSASSAGSGIFSAFWAHN